MYRCFPMEHAARSRDRSTAMCDEPEHGMSVHDIFAMSLNAFQTHCA